MRKYWLVLLQGAFSVFLIWHIFSNPSLRSEVSRVLAAADPRWLGIGLLAALLNESFAAVRWWLVLRAFGTPVGLGRVFLFCGAGIFFSLGLPGTAGGDAFRILYIIRLYPKKKLRASLSVLADRLCGLVSSTLALSLSVGLRYPLFAHDPVTRQILMAAIALLGGTLFLVFLWWLTTFPGIRTLWVPENMDSLRRRVSHLGYVFSGLTGRPGLIGAGILASVGAIMAHFTTYFCSARAFTLPVSLEDIFTVMPVVDTLIVLPVTLFGIGLRETLFNQLLGSLFAIPSGAATLTSLGGFGLQAAVALLGAFCVPFTTVEAARIEGAKVKGGKV